MPRSARRLVTALLVATVQILSLGAGAATAEEGYRYWNYHHLSAGSWEFSKVGAAGYRPKDGAVEGYRFAAAANSDKDGVPPRADLGEVSFRSVCGGEKAAADQKRVAVVVDYGTGADAEGDTPPDPRAACAVVAGDATGQQALDAVADVRTQDGLVCGIDGYPAQGCGAPVSDVQPTRAERPVAFELPADEAPAADDGSAGEAADAPAEDDGGFPWTVVAAALVAALIGVGAFALSRRRGTA